MGGLPDLGPDAPIVAESSASLRLPPSRPLHPAIIAARASIDAALRGALLLADGELPLHWSWRGHDDRVDRRYGLYRLFELLEAAAAAASRVAAVPGGLAAGRILGQATEARWDLHGLLLPLAADDLDRPPGGQEWTLREILGHLALTQARYTLNTAFWALAAPTSDRPPPEAPATPLTSLERRAAWSAGAVLDIRARLDARLDLAVGLLGDLDDAARLEALGTWVGYPVTVRFRLHRFAAHLREHTIQVEQTLALLGRQPKEVERIVRLILCAYGRLEAVVLCPQAETLDRSYGDDQSLTALLTATAREVAVVASSLPA